MPWGFAAAAVGSVASAAIGAGAAGDASSAQQQSAQNAANLSADQFNQTKANLYPFLQGGTDANAALMGGLGINAGSYDPNAPLLKGFQFSGYSPTPGAQWGLDQGLSAIQNKSSATGVTGNTLKDLTSYAQNYGQNDYWNQYNAANSAFNTQQTNAYSRLANTAGSGQNAAAMQGSLGATAAQTTGNALIGAGNASAAGTIGAANAVGGAVNGLSSNALLAYLTQQPNNNLAPTSNTGMAFGNSSLWNQNNYGAYNGSNYSYDGLTL